MQSIILISLILWSVINPTTNLALVISIGLIIAIASATQDITVDALRIEQINENEGRSMAAGAAIAVVGWWTGYKLGGVVALFTAEYFENIGIANYWQSRPMGTHLLHQEVKFLAFLYLCKLKVSQPSFVFFQSLKLSPKRWNK